MEHYDVVIVGAGPSGLMAARTLADSNDKNINFLVTDSKKEIGLPLKCGEGIRKNGFLELFKRTNFDFVKNETNKFEIWAGKTKRILHVEYIVLDRPKFEKWLAQPIKNRVKLNTTCEDIVKRQDCLEVITNKGRIKADMVILAHGCNYGIQKKFNLIRKIPLMFPCYGGIFTDHNLDTNTLYFFFDDNNSTALWLFPKDKNTANVGIGVIPYLQKTDIRILFKQSIARYCSKLKGRPSFGGVFPTSGPIKRTYANRMLVCGDAAGQVYAGTEEGIYFALKSGQLAAKTAVKAVKKGNFKAPFLKQYEKDWKRCFGNQLKASLIFYDILFLGFKCKKLEEVFKLPEEKELINLFMHGKVPFKVKLVHSIAKLYWLFNPKQRKVPFMLRFLWKLYKTFRQI